MSSTLSEAEAEKRLAVLHNNIGTLQNAVEANRSELGTAADVLDNELETLQADLKAMEEEYTALHAYNEGLRRLRRLRTDEAIADEAMTVVNEAVDGKLDSW